MRLLPLLVLASLLLSSRAGAGEPARAGMEFFERKIRPLLVDNCFKCHTGPKLKGHLALDSRAALLKGGDTGPALVPGAPGQSLIIKAIGYQDPELRMPPRGKLNVQQIDDVAAWIKVGAPWPGVSAIPIIASKEFNLKERKGHWSLLPLASHGPPVVKNKSWVRSPIDAFLLARLEEKGFAP
ncbi:MAG TPA: c-type cytochrome domain-containing protein, partial [Gemmataceae bacterium]|nr:c-type cytochrome domain-containing protein [Gemmataceae bacterium]